MSSVDDRIVNMQFNNKQFESGVSQSQRSLQGLESSISKTAQSKGLTGLASSVDGVKNRFSAMQVAGVAAVATIASKATAFGINLVKDLTLKPIMDGFNEYQTNLNSIQTIVANTGKSVPRVNAALAQLNHYADQTIYNFSEMAHNIGTFTAAGVDLKTSVASIKGIANLAALSGSSSQQASMAMYQLSQAIAAGQVHLQDWNSVVNAGMGGKVFQTALARTGANMGTLSKNAVQMVGPMKKLQVQGQSFRESISAKPGQKAWLSSDVLTETLKQISGAYSVAQLKAKGYTKEQIKNIESLANRSFNAATQIKTFPQLFGVIQESIGSMWGQTFQAILGDFNQSKNLWGAVGAKLVGPFGIITQMSNNFTGMMQNWADKGGRNAVINGFKMMFGSLGQILTQVKSAFTDIFPPKTTSNLLAMSQAFYTFTTYLNPSTKTLQNLKSIFGGVFAVFHIGITIVKALAAGFGAFFGEIFQGSGQARGGVLDFMGNIGKMLIHVDKFLTSGGKMVDLFRNIGKAAGGIAGKGISIASGIIMGLISGLTGSIGQIQSTVVNIATQIVDWFKSTLGIHSPARELIPVGTQIVAGIAQGILGAIKLVAASIGKVVGSIMTFFNNQMGHMDPFAWATLMNTLFTGTLLISVSRFFGAFRGIGKSIMGTFNQLTSTLKTMQTEIKAEAIKKIALSVVMLSGALIALSFVKPEKLAVSIGAMGAIMAIMIKTFSAMNNIGETSDKSLKGAVANAIRIKSLAGAMRTMATAMAILSGAVVLLGHQKPETLIKGIGALTVMMALMVGAIAGISKMGPMAKGAGIAMVMMATAMNILSISIAGLGQLDVKTLAKGIGAMAFMMAIMVVSLAALGQVGKGAVQAAGAIAIVAGAMTALAAIVFLFGNMDMGTLAKGIGSMAIMLGLMVVSLGLLAGIAPGVLVVAQSMALFSLAMVGLAIAVGMFGNMDAGTLAKGFGAVAAGLIILGLAAAAAIPLAPGLAILSGTFLALGEALALAGLGMLAFGTGFALMAAVGTAGVAVLVVAFQAFMALLPALGVQFAAAFVAFVQTIAAASNRLRPAFDTIFKNMIGVIQDNIPVIGGLIQTLISTAIGIIKRSVPQWIEMGFTIIDKFIASVAKHVPNIVDSALKLVTGFIKAIARNLGPLADSAAKMIISFINAVSAAIDNNSAALGTAGGKLGISLVKGMISGMGGMVGQVIGAAEDLAKAALGGIHKIFHNPPVPSREGIKLGSSLARGIAVGITAGAAEAVAAAVRMANAIISAGDQAVAAVQARARGAQAAADSAQAQADLAKQAASKVNAKKSPKLAKTLKKRADAAQNAADAAQAQADAATQQVQDAKDFAAADNVGKGDIVSSRAVDLAAAASKALAKANAEAAKARTLRGKAAKAMLAQAQRDAAAAQSLSNQAMAANREANTYYANEVRKRLDDIKAADDAKKAQEDYNAADTAGKMDILKNRADSAQAQADAKYTQAAALVEQARGLAATDAAGALRLLDQADQLRSDAQTFADQAQQAKDQAAQLAGGAAGAGGIDNGSTIQPSRSVLEDAASAMDTYTASMIAASESAAATQQVVQFNQVNNSPVALTVSEVYRQTNNLLSAKEIKMGANSN